MSFVGMAEGTGMTGVICRNGGSYRNEGCHL